MNYRAAGFTQRKPSAPGVYFISTIGGLRNDIPRIAQGWDVACIVFFAGSFGGSVHDNREDLAHWRIQTLGGVSYAWRKGMWIKGPIKPDPQPDPSWINVNDHLPKLGAGWVLVTRNTISGTLVDSAVFEGSPGKDRRWLRLRCPENGKPYEFSQCDVTHWQPYPASALGVQ